MPCLEQTSAIMILHLSLSSVIRSKIMLSLFFPVTKELKLSRNVILCLPLLLVPSILPVRDKNSSPLWRHISMLMERCIEVQKDLYICFIDYSKAFDKVKHEKLFEMLNQLDIDGKDLRVLRNLYWDQTAAVRVGGELSEYTNIKRGMRQGCVMSPDVFNLYSEVILRNLDGSEGLKANGENLNNLRYADDTSLLAGSEEASKYCCRRE